MARYIKANPKVAQFLRLENDRNQVTDGNYLLWQADILAFGKLIDLPQILEQIGGIALMAHEAREEQDGTVLRELPVATDPRFIIDPEPEPEPEDGNETEGSTEGDENNAAEDDAEGGQADKEPATDQQPADPQPEPEKPAAVPKKKSLKNKVL